MEFLKDNFAIDRAVKFAYSIARGMDLEYVRTLDPRDLWGFTDNADVTGISRGELDGFRNADLIIEAMHPHDGQCYIAVEASYTVDLRDTSRAARHAGFLTRFTGKPAYAAVAGVRRDYEVENILSGDGVYWHQILAHHLQGN